MPDVKIHATRSKPVKKNRRSGDAADLSAELRKVNAALHASIEALAHEPALESFVPIVLSVAAETFGASSCSFFEVDDSETIFLRYIFHQGRVITPLELPLLDESKFGTLKRLADGFTVPVEHLGVHATRRNHSVLLDHRTATASPEFHAFALSVGWELELNVPLLVGGRVRGCFLIHRHGDAPFSESDVSLAESLGRQLTLALQASRNAAREREAAVAREREQAAQDRAEELAKANDALQATVDATSQVLELDELVPKVLDIIANVFETENCSIFENFASGEVRLWYWHTEGKTLLPEELLRLDEEKHSLVRHLAAGFMVPPGYLGQSPLTAGTVFLDHVKGTSVPEFDQWAVSIGCDLELNIGIASQGVRCATLCVYRPRHRPFSKREIILAEALAQQIGLALQVTKLSQTKLEAAIAVEREEAAQDRAEELERMAGALQETIDSLSKISDLDELVPVVLQIVARTLGANSCAVYEHRDETVFLRFWFVEGRVFSPSELMSVDLERFGLVRRLAAGFTVPVDYLGTTVRERTRAVVVDHVAGTSVPEFDSFACSVGWDLELNVPIVSGSLAIGALCVYRTKRGGAYTPQEIRFAESLSAQLAMAMLAKDLAAKVQDRAIETVIAREREQAAQMRADELAKANEVLRRGADHLVGNGDIHQFLNLSLSEATRLTGANSGGVFIRTGHGTEMRLKAHWPELPVDTHAALSEKMAGVTLQDKLGIYARTLAGEFTTVNPQDERIASVFPEAVQYHRAQGHQVAWHLTLRVGGRSIGFMGLAFKTAPSSGFIRESLKTLVQQIALALELIRLGEDARNLAISREKRRAAEERVAELARANATVSRSLAAVSQSSDFDDTLEKVFLEIVASANASAGHLFLHDAQANTLQTIVWIDEQGNGRGFCPDSPPLLQTAFNADITPAFRLCLDAKDFFAISFNHLTPEQAALAWPGTTEWHLARGRESACAIPVMVGQRPVGMIGLAWKDQFSFSTEQRELLFALTHQAAMVMQLRELANSQRAAAISHEREQAAQERAGELAKANSILRRVNERLSGETNYRAVLGLLLSELSFVVGNISGGIFTFDANTFLLRFVLGFEDGKIVDELIGHPHGRADRPADARVFLGWTDLTTRPAQELVKLTPGNAAPPSNEWHSARQHRLLFRTPLIANEEPVGTLCLAFANEGPLDPLKLELCNAVAQQATLALQLARLSDQARQADVARERETTILQERTRFAGQIHDTLAQGFTGTLLHLEALRVRAARGELVTVQEIQNVRKIAALGLAEARRSALAIRPLALDGRDLSTALQQLTERSAVPGLLDCRWSLGGIPRPLSPIADEAFLNIAHEAVSNAIRHADASNIHITLAFDPDGVSLLVRDDGIGFDASDSRQRGHTFGLRSMRERAAAIGGELSVVSRNGKGTTVTVHLPTA